MMRFVLFLLVLVFGALTLMALPAPAQSGSGSYQTRPDELRLDLLTENHALVEYWNSDAQSSRTQTRELVAGDLVVEVRVEVGAGGPEILTVTAPDGWVALPEVIHVIDGDLGRIDLIRGEWHGS